MYLSDIQYDTNFNLEFEDGSFHRGFFDGRIDHMQFYLHCPEILSEIDSFINREPTMKFFVSDKCYTFTALITGASNRRPPALRTIDIKIISPIKEGETGRADIRINLSMQVRVHHHDEDPKSLFLGDMICNSKSVDISKSGIRLWADANLIAHKGNYLTLAFSISKDWTYIIPSKLLRAEKNRTTLSYAFDYGLQFDFSTMEHRQEKLLMDILESKIRQ